MSLYYIVKADTYPSSTWDNLPKPRQFIEPARNGEQTPCTLHIYSRFKMCCFILIKPAIRCIQLGVHSLISHQIGAESLILCLQMMPLTPMIMHWMRRASENMCKPIFHDRKVFRDRGRSMRIQARKLTIGVKG